MTFKDAIEDLLFYATPAFKSPSFRFCIADGIHGPPRCFFCLSPEQESLDHVFSNGDLASSVWNFFGAECGILPSGVSLRVRLVSWWYTYRANPQVSFVLRLLPCFVCWHLWKTRNLAFFDSKILRPQDPLVRMYPGKD